MGMKNAVYEMVALFPALGAHPRRRKPAFDVYDNEASVCVYDIVLKNVIVIPSQLRGVYRFQVTSDPGDEPKASISC
jgi:hypothetical protein